jgi:ectoine hydroxylase-related dioxygenase (phytanoyl-CoA dioxygenase family)
VERVLNNRQIEEFFDTGFTSVEQFFDSREMAEISAGFDSLLEIAAEIAGAPGFDPDEAYRVGYDGAYFDFKGVDAQERRFAIRKIAWCGGAVPVLLRYGRHPRLLRAASQLLGCDEMNHLINQAHLKMPGTNVAFGWHQDSVNRGLHKGYFADVNGRGSFVQSGLAVDSVSADSGPLAFIPTSGGAAHLEHTESGHLLPHQVDEARQLAPLPRCGDLLLWHPYTIHGSKPNLSGRPRRILINGFAYPGANKRSYVGSEKGAGELIRAPR